MLEQREEPRFFLHIDTAADGVSSRWYFDFAKMRGKVALDLGEGLTFRYEVRRRGVGEWQFSFGGPSGAARRRMLRGRSDTALDAVWPPQPEIIEVGEDSGWQSFEGFVSRTIEAEYARFLSEPNDGDD